MKQEIFEKIIKDKIYNSQSEVDTDLLWKNIQAKKKKKRVIPFWIYLGALIPIFYFIGHSVYSNYYPAEKTSNSALVENNSKQSQSDLQATTENEAHSTSENNIISQKLNGDLKNNNESSAETNSLENVVTSKTNTTNHKKNTKQNQSTKANEALATTVYATKSDIKNENTDSNKTNNKLENSGKKLIIKGDNRNKIIDNSLQYSNPNNKQSNNIAKVNGTDIKSKFDTQNEAISNENVTDQNIVVNTISDKLNRSFLASNTINYTGLSQLLNNQEINLPLVAVGDIVPNSGIPISISSKFSIFIAPVFSAYGINKTLSSKERFPDAQNLNSQYDKQLEQLEYGLTIGLLLRNNIYFKTGLLYSQTTNKITRSWDDTQQLTLEDQIVEVITFQDGSQQTVRTDIQVEQHLTYELEQYNRLKMLDIPLIIGYQSKIAASKWRIYGEAGVLLNVSTKYDGQHFIENKQLTKLDEPNIYKSSVGLGYSGALGLKRQIGSNLFLGIKAKGKMYNSDFSTEDYAFKVKYKFFGLSTELNYLF